MIETSAETPWMLREIEEQPATLAATLNRYVEQGQFRRDTCAPLREWLANARHGIVIAASGSSRHAGLAGEILLEDLSGIAVDVEYASEYIYRSERALKDSALLVLSQSGETADTLMALRRGQRCGQATMAITNVAGSSMAREADVSFPTEAGRERAIPATKSFTAQLLNLYLLALLAAEEHGTLPPQEIRRQLALAAALPPHIAAQLHAWRAAAQGIAQAYDAAETFLFLGRSVHYAIAREGALKLKEASYVHAEGYPSGELKHGPNALVSDTVPLVMIATVDRTDEESVERYEKVLHLMRDMRSQGADILALANAGDRDVAALAKHTIFVEETIEALLPIAEVVPLQLLACFMAISRGRDVDRPRNLAKAVVAE